MAPPTLTPAHENCYNLPILRGLRFIGTIHSLTTTKDYYARAYEEYMVVVTVQGSKDELNIKRKFVAFHDAAVGCPRNIGVADWISAYELLKVILYWPACRCGGPSVPSRTNMFARLCVSCGEPAWPRMDDSWELTPDPIPSRKRKRSARGSTSTSCDASDDEQAPSDDDQTDEQAASRNEDEEDTIILSEEDSTDLPVRVCDNPHRDVVDYARDRLVTNCANQFEKCSDVWCDFKEWTVIDGRGWSRWSSADFNKAMVSNCANKVKVLGTTVFVGVKFK